MVNNEEKPVKQGLTATLPTLVLSFHDEGAYRAPTLQAGADGYLMKDSGTALLVQRDRERRRGAASS